MSTATPVTAASTLDRATEPATVIEPGPDPKAKRRVDLAFLAFFVLMAIWGAWIATREKVEAEVFDPTVEFALDRPLFGGSWELFGIDFAINKGVAYLLIALALVSLFALYVNRTVVQRLKQETRTQSMVEGIYEFAHDQIAGSLGSRVFSRWMPFVASIFIFVWFLNLISFLPLPLNIHDHHGDTVYAFGLYAVTSNIYMTITLALMTFFIYHFEGIRAHGPVGYLKTWTAGQPFFPFGWFVFLVEILTNLVLKPISLAVRLFANMLSGHMLILLMLALAGIIGGSIITNVFVQSFGIVIALVFYLFEFVLVASLQAFIFAVLSAIYIGGAAEEHH